MPAPLPYHAVRPYLRLRRQVIGRQLGELGWLRLLLLGSMLGAGVLQALVRATQHPWAAWLVPVAVGSLLWPAHRRRGDLRFLRQVSPGFQLGVAAEYGLLTLPLTLVLLALRCPGPALLTLAVAPPLAWLPPARESGLGRGRRSLFRSEAFEWVSGMRAALGWLVWLGLLSLAGWLRATPLGPVLALAGWLLVVLSFYGTPEPATMLLLAARRPGAFLRRRLLLGLGYVLLTGAPFAALLLLGSAGAGAALALSLVLVLLTALLILAKYAFYPNAVLIRFTQAAVVALVLSQPGNPIFPPLLAAVLGGLVWQCRRRLQMYRYDG